MLLVGRGGGTGVSILGLIADSWALCVTQPNLCSDSVFVSEGWLVEEGV